MLAFDAVAASFALWLLTAADASPETDGTTVPWAGIVTGCGILCCTAATRELIGAPVFSLTEPVERVSAGIAGIASALCVFDGTLSIFPELKTASTPAAGVLEDGSCTVDALAAVLSAAAMLAVAAPTEALTGRAVLTAAANGALVLPVTASCFERISPAAPTIGAPPVVAPTTGLLLSRTLLEAELPAFESAIAGRAACKTDLGAFGTSFVLITGTTSATDTPTGAGAFVEVAFSFAGEPSA
jgi:hypothetical protein